MLDFDSFDYFENLLVIFVAVVPAFALLPWLRGRRVMLALAGMYLLFLIAPRLLAFYVPFWLAVFILQHIIGRVPEHRWRPWALGLAISAVLAPMVLWKVFPTQFIIHFNVILQQRLDAVSPYLGAIDRIRDIILPIGLSFATFRAIDLMIKVSLGVHRPLSASRMAAFAFFPPVQVIGPVIEYEEIERGLDQRVRITPDDIAAGVMQIAVGLCKVFIISYALESSGDVLVRFADAAWWEAWAELFLFALYFFFNFAGFSDIAIGASRLLGLRLKPNFNNPYLRTTPPDFWNNWHMSLTRFAQRNVFVPLGGMRAEHQYAAIFATIMVIALWHDITWALVLFGCYHAAGLIGHRMLAKRRPAASHQPWYLYFLKMSGLFVFVTLSFPMLILRFDRLADFYSHLFGIG